MPRPYLIRPTEAYRQSYLDAWDEGFILGGDRPGRGIDPHSDFQAHLEALDHTGQGVFIYKDKPFATVPSLAYWLVNGSQFLGAISIRSRITSPILAHWGGHIGYGIRPSAQGRGHGKLQLALGLDICRGIGIAIARISCRTDNLASRKVIEANGGIFLRESMMDGVPLLLFEHILIPAPTL